MSKIGYLTFLLAAVALAQPPVPGRDPRWRTVGSGSAAQTPATCTANRDVYLCTGAGCTSGNNILYCTATNTFTAQGVAAGSGITSLNGLNGATQTFGNDTNVTMVSVGSTHTLTWAGTLASARGGLGASFAACTGNLTFAAGVAACSTTTGTLGNVVYSIAPTITGHPTIEGVTSTGATGSGQFVFGTGPTISAPAITGHPTIEGVTSTGAQGSGAVVFATSPTLTTPTLGVASATTINKVTLTTPLTGSTLTIADGKTLTASNTLTLTGTDASSIAFGTGGTVAYTANNLSAFAATTSAQLFGVISDETGGAGVLVGSASPTFTGTIAAAALTLTGALTTNVTAGGVQCLQANNTGVVSGTGGGCGGTPPLSGITAAAGSNTISNLNNPQSWGWTQTTNTQYGMKFFDTGAATNGTGVAQGLVAVVTAAGSTEVPLTITSSLTGTQTIPALYLNPTWNVGTSVVDAAILVNVTCTACGATSKLIDLQVGSTPEFTVDSQGNVSMAGSINTGVGGSNAGFQGYTQGTANTACANCVGFQAPTSVTSAFYFTLPGAPAAGFLRATNATPSVISQVELSGDCTTSGSAAITCTKVNGVSYPTTPSLFDSIPIATSSANVQYSQINGGSNCGDASHALSYNQTTHLFGCQSITGAAAAGGSNTQVQFNSTGALGGITQLTTNGTTTISLGTTGIFDLSAATGTAAFKIPTTTTNTASAVGVIDYDTTNSNYHCNNGADCLFGVVPTASAPANGNVIDSSLAASKFQLHDSGVATANLVTAASNYTNGDLVQAAGANKTTSDSGIATANVVTAASNYTNGNLVQAAGANKTTSDSGIATANVVTAASAAAAAKQICVASGTSKTCTFIDAPETKTVPFCANVNGTVGTGIDTTTAVTCTARAGTNNKGAFYGPFTTSDSVTFQLHLPKDWDTGTAPSLSVDLASTDATNGHTVILQAATQCFKLDGTTTDDVAFNAAQSMGTVTLGAGGANQSWTATLASLTTTGCSAPGIMKIKITRTTDTATNVELYQANVTVPRLFTVQAN